MALVYVGLRFTKSTLSSAAGQAPILIGTPNRQSLGNPYPQISNRSEAGFIRENRALPRV